MFRRYLLRYGRDVFQFVAAYALAGMGMLPSMLLMFGMYSAIFYMTIIVSGLAAIFLVAVVTSILDSYRFKLLVFIAAVAFLTYWGWPVLGPMLIVYAQWIYLFPIAYAFLERHGLKKHYERLWEEDR